MLLRDDPDFATALGRAAADLREHAAFVEKDYWVTQALRSLVAAEGPGVLLKGGTSLSKGYGIIDRFSEDVDILLVRRAGQTARSVEARLAALTAAVAADLGLPWEPMRAPGRGVHASRGDWIRYPSVPDRATGLPITADAVLLETRVGEGHEPSEMVTVAPIVARWPVVADAGYEDLAPFDLRVLEPRRTLVEKLVAVHTTVEAWTPDGPADQARFGRHYYDIFRLLGHAPTVAALADREGFLRIHAEVERVSAEAYRGAAPRPEGGFAAATAFAPPRDGELRAWLEASYALSLRLVPGDPVGLPTFGAVLKRVAAHAALL